MFPTFDWFLMLALLMGTIRGHDDDRPHPRPDYPWHAIQPLLPTPPPRYGGRPRVDDRAALAGIVYQLRTGVPWRLLLGFVYLACALICLNSLNRPKGGRQAVACAKG
jgi:hypothetical protein